MSVRSIIRETDQGKQTVGFPRSTADYDDNHEIYLMI